MLTNTWYANKVSLLIFAITLSLILQGSGVTQTVLGGLSIYPPVVNFLQCTCAKNYENGLAVEKVIAKISRLTFLAHPVFARKTLSQRPISSLKCFTTYG